MLAPFWPNMLHGNVLCASSHGATFSPEERAAGLVGGTGCAASGSVRVPWGAPVKSASAPGQQVCLPNEPQRHNVGRPGEFRGPFWLGRVVIYSVGKQFLRSGHEEDKALRKVLASQNLHSSRSCQAMHP